MYFSMDEIGFENADKIKSIAPESGRWRYIYDIAPEYGFEGIHLTPSLYKSFSLDLENIPDYFRDFKLTLHFGGLYKIATDDDYAEFNNNLEKYFNIAFKYNMHDISFHPPVIKGYSDTEKELSLERFHKIADKWTESARHRGITFSLESHLYSEYFIFGKLEEYAGFIEAHPGLGVLIDISHNCYSGYTENDIINLLGDKNIKGLHISDAVRRFEFREGTHLPVGGGEVDFEKLLKYFNKIPGLYGVLEIKSDNEGIKNSLTRLNNIIC